LVDPSLNLNWTVFADNTERLELLPDDTVFADDTLFTDDILFAGEAVLQELFADDAYRFPGAINDV